MKNLSTKELVTKKSASSILSNLNIASDTGVGLSQDLRENLEHRRKVKFEDTICAKEITAQAQAMHIKYKK